MGLSVRQFVHRHHLQKKPSGYWETFEITDEHFGVKWRSKMHKGRSNGFTGFCFYKCLESANLTGAQVSATARFFSGKANVHEHHISQLQLASPVGLFGFCVEVNTREKLDSFLELTFRVTAPFPLVHPLPLRKKTWDFSVPGLTDVVLKVEDEKFHVSKILSLIHILSTHSSYFNSLFFGPFCETEKSEIELQEVNPETLQAFLQCLYNSADIHEDNVKNLLDMARMYDVQSVTNQCKKFLKEENDLGEEETKRLCEEYNLKYEKQKEVLMRPYVLARDGQSSSN